MWAQKYLQIYSWNEVATLKSLCSKGDETPGKFRPFKTCEKFYFGL